MNAAAQSGAEAASDHGRIPLLDIEPRYEPPTYGAFSQLLAH